MRVLATIFAMLIASTAQAQDIRTMLDQWSDWHGVGIQSDGLDWQMQVTTAADGTLQVDYPGIPCNGFWQIAAFQDAGFDAIEIITQGEDLCFNGGEVRVSALNDSMLMYQWFDGDAPSASAVLIPGIMDMANYAAMAEITRSYMPQSDLPPVGNAPSKQGGASGGISGGLGLGN